MSKFYSGFKSLLRPNYDSKLKYKYFHDSIKRIFLYFFFKENFMDLNNKEKA